MKKRLVLFLMLIVFVVCLCACDSQNVVEPKGVKVCPFGYKIGDENAYFIPIDGVNAYSFVEFGGATVNADEENVFFIMNVKSKGDMKNLNVRAEVSVDNSKSFDFDVAKSAAINGFNVLEKNFAEETSFKLVFNIGRAEEEKYNNRGEAAPIGKYLIRVTNMYTESNYQGTYYYTPPTEAAE